MSKYFSGTALTRCGVKTTTWSMRTCWGHWPGPMLATISDGQSLLTSVDTGGDYGSKMSHLIRDGRNGTGQAGPSCKRRSRPISSLNTTAKCHGVGWPIFVSQWFTGLKFFSRKGNFFVKVLGLWSLKSVLISQYCLRFFHVAAGLTMR